MNLNRIFDGLMSSGLAGGLAGGAASGLLVQGLGSKKGRKMAGSALKLGGAAVVGGLAWKAYEQYRSRDAGTPLAAGAGAVAQPAQPAWTGLREEAFLPQESASAAYRDLLVLRAMITAAHADGHVDAQERMAIYERIETLQLSHAEKGLLIEEISSPLDLYQLVQQVNSPALAAEVYLAAVLMVDPREPAHQPFLNELAQRLALPPELVATLEAQGTPASSLPPINLPRAEVGTISPQA